MYVKSRYAALFILAIGLLAHNVCHADDHVGSSSIAKGVIYQCPNNHTVDVFGDEDSDIGFSAVVDHHPALPGVAMFHFEAAPGILGNNAMIFNKGKDYIRLSQDEVRTQDGDHGVDIAYIVDGKEVWHYASCHAE